MNKILTMAITLLCSTVVLAMDEQPSLYGSVTLKPQIISTAIEVFNKINANWTYCPPGRDKGILITDSPYWAPNNIEADCMLSGKRISTSMPTLVLKGPVSNICVAIHDLVGKKASLECTIAITSAKIACLMKIIGEKPFTSYAQWLHSILIDTHGHSNHLFQYLPIPFIKYYDHGPTMTYEIPAIVYIANIPEYAEIKPDGNGRGINVFCTGEDQYIGFGQIYKEGPRTLAYIKSNELLAEFNKKEDVQKAPLKHEEYVSLFRYTPTAYSIMRQQEQKNVPFYEVFDFDKIAKYINQSEIEFPEELL